MNGLTADDFADFLDEVHGRRPYPWQRALVEHILDKGAWPDVLDVPTGLGKTTVIDVAVFVAAARPQIARRRVFFVVDRRLVVDEAYDHAQTLAGALGDPSGPVSAAVARALAQPGDEGSPLQVTRMRGGTTWSWRWLERPDRHAVIVGTIDQIGSRLLFRGYGVGAFLRPIDAALTGTDSLIVLDEAHLAEPFKATLAAALDLGQGDVGRCPLVLTMSATTRHVPDDVVLGITSDDVLDEQAGLRLRARRSMTLIQAAATKKNAHIAIPRLMADWATFLAGEADSGRVVLAVCNTVARARAVHDMVADDGRADTVLLTGRSRPIDREYLMHRWYPRIRVGRAREAGRPLIVCATQTVEVGANIDADALVTESAALAALIQRFGRLNRTAQLDHAPALVVHDPTTGEDDPVYGPTRQATWQWLTELTPPLSARAARTPTPLDGGCDVSPQALARYLRELHPDRHEQMRQPPPYTPVLFPTALSAWTRTSPTPHPDTPVAPYLHGLGHGTPDVTLVWRSGLPSDDSTRWVEIVEPLPPAIEEAVQVPVHAVRRWLTRPDDTDALGDVEGQPDEPGTGDSPAPQRRQVLRHRGDFEVIDTRAIRPGDLIIVPASWGGCDEYGWNPTSTKTVRDLADLASRRGRPAVRLRRGLVDIAADHHPWLVNGLTDLIAQATNDARSEDRPAAGDYRAALKRLLSSCPQEDKEMPLVRNLRLLAERCTASVAQSTMLLSRKGGGWTGDVGSLGSSALGIGEPIGLAEHQQAVAARAEEFATNLHLPAELVNAVKAAAGWHDEGKRDPRFQAMLRGRPVRASTRLRERDLLAKSGLNGTDRAAFRRARLLAGYPEGMRHEALSAQIAALHLAEHDEKMDRSLVRHLVAAHHGRSRPLLPPISDPQPRTIAVNGHQLGTGLTVDWDAPQRFAELNQRYGPWGLALLETIVRLADIWCSERDETEREVM